MATDKTGYTVSRSASTGRFNGVFRDVSSNKDGKTRVMSSETYSRASDRANKSLAASALTQRFDKKR